MSPRTSLFFEDCDFYNLDIEQSIIIQVTLADWDLAQPGIEDFFKENKYGQFKCGLDDTGPIAEPSSNGVVAISISLRVDKGLEPKWFIIKGYDNNEEQQEEKLIFAGDRAKLGISRIDLSADANFTWGRNAILTRLSDNGQGGLNDLLVQVNRTVREFDISKHDAIAGCHVTAASIQLDAKDIGVKLFALSPKLDIQRQSLGAGTLSLHEGAIPKRDTY